MFLGQLPACCRHGIVSICKNIYQQKTSHCPVVSLQAQRQTAC